MPIRAAYGPRRRDRPCTASWFVDDDVQLTAFISELIATELPDAELAVAHDGFEAGIQVAHSRPDLVLLDLMMPGLNGFAVCEYLKTNAATSAVRVVAMTGFPTEENTDRILSLGAEACLVKPFDQDDLLMHLQPLEKPAAD